MFRKHTPSPTSTQTKTATETNLWGNKHMPCPTSKQTQRATQEGSRGSPPPPQGSGEKLTGMDSPPQSFGVLPTDSILARFRPMEMKPKDAHSSSPTSSCLWWTHAPGTESLDCKTRLCLYQETQERFNVEGASEFLPHLSATCPWNSGMRSGFRLSCSAWAKDASPASILSYFFLCAVPSCVTG